MAENARPVTLIVGATSKWQSDGRNTHLAHGGDVDDADCPPSVRWGVGGALALRFASEGHHVVLTTRNASNAAALEDTIRDEGGSASTIVSDESIAPACRRRPILGAPDVVIYNVGYLEQTFHPRRSCSNTSPRDLPDRPAPREPRPFLVAQAAPRPCANADTARS